MDVEIYSKNMLPLGNTDNIESLIWTRNYFTPGEFKIKAIYTERNKNLLQPGNLVFKHQDNEPAQIYFVSFASDDNGAEYIEATGYLLTQWLNKRIILNPIVLTDTPPNIAGQLIADNMTNPLNTARKFDNTSLLITAPDTNPIDYIAEQYTGLKSSVEYLIKYSNLGMRFLSDKKTKAHTIEIFEGTNRTQHQPNRCIFSIENGTLTTQTLTQDSGNYKNTCYITGKDNTLPPVEVGDDFSGIDRDEFYVNASDIEQETLTRSDSYNNLLTTRAREEIEQRNEIYQLDSEFNSAGALKYRKNFDVGDMVTIKNKRWGVTNDVRITQITETHQDNTVLIDIAFGEGLPKLIDAIRISISK